MNNTPPEKQPAAKTKPSVGFWGEAWQRFKRKKLGMIALTYIVLLTLIAIFSPAIAGTRPVVCKYKGNLYFPCMVYFNPAWENPIFHKDDFRKRYPQELKAKDPESWAIWPLFYQDPYRRVYIEQDWPDRASNPVGTKGMPSFLRNSAAPDPENDPENDPNISPAVNHFGTTQDGVDVLAQMVHGTRIALLVGFVSTGISALIGIAVGAMAGYLGGWVDILLSRLIELVMCIPSLILILALLAIVDTPTIWHMMIILGVTSWTGIARLTRAEFLKLGKMEYVTAARALGVGRTTIMFRHILRNALAPLLVPISFGIASAILIEAGLSFLGFGAPPPNPSWGTLLMHGKEELSMWWLLVFPGTAIFFTVLAYNLIGEGIQEATDPRLRQAGH